MAAVCEKQQQEEDQQQLSDHIEEFLEQCRSNGNDEPSEQWKRLHRSLLSPSTPFSIHRACYERVYQHSDTTVVPGPLWYPPDTLITTTHTQQLQQQLGLPNYKALYEYSITSRDAFWMQAAKDIVVWNGSPPTQAFAGSSNNNDITYFPNGRLNIADSCLQDDNNTAIVFANDTDPTHLQRWSTAELRALVHRVAHQIHQHPLGAVGASSSTPGTTRIGVCLPMTPEAVAVYLGIIQAGCVVVSIADSFSSAEIATRCRLAQVEWVVTQDVIVRPNKVVPLYGRVLQALELLTDDSAKDNEEKEQKDAEEECVVDGSKIPVMVIPASLHTGHTSKQEEAKLHESIELRAIDQSWFDFLASSIPEFDSIIVDSMTPSNILFSSGTTGTPKSIVWSHTTPIKCAVDGHFHQNIGPDDVVCWPTSLGWMMGSWLIAQRMNGATIALYQGLPHTPKFAKFVEAAGVTMLGVIPSLVQSWYNSNITDHADWSKVSRFSSTGEASDPRIYHWLMSRVPGYAPVIEYCGGTEIGGSFLSSVLDLPNIPSHFNTPVLGSELRLMDHHGRVLPDHYCSSSSSSGGTHQHGDDVAEVRGELVLVPPSIGYSTTLLHRSHDDCYFTNMPLHHNGVQLRRHGDAFGMVRSSNAVYFKALGRCDDTMNLGGIKVSTVELERAVLLGGVVTEVAAVAVGQPSRLILYVVVAAASGSTDLQQLRQQCQAAIKQHLNPLFQVRDVVVLEKLPRTASNKVMRRLLRDDYDERLAAAPCQ